MNHGQFEENQTKSERSIKLLDDEIQYRKPTKNIWIINDIIYYTFGRPPSSKQNTEEDHLQTNTSEDHLL